MTIYIYIFRCITSLCFVVSQLSCVPRHARFSKLGSKPERLICQRIIHIYIVIHRQTVSFYQNSSVRFDR